MATPNPTDNMVDIVPPRGSSQSITSVRRLAPLEDTAVHHRPKKKGMQKAPRPKPHHCPNCTSRFDRPCALKQHLRVHTGEKPYKCEKCARAFATSSNSYRHARRCSSSAKRRPPTAKAQRPPVVVARERPQVGVHAPGSSISQAPSVPEGPATSERWSESAYSPPSLLPTIPLSVYDSQHPERYNSSSLANLSIPPSHPMCESGYPPSTMEDLQDPPPSAQTFNFNIAGGHHTLVRPNRHPSPSFSAGPHGIGHPTTYMVAENAKVPMTPMYGSHDLGTYDAIPLSPLSPQLSTISSGHTRYGSISPMSTDVESPHSFPPSPSQYQDTPLFPLVHHHYSNVPMMEFEFSPDGRRPKPMVQTNIGSGWHNQTLAAWPSSGPIQIHGDYSRRPNSEYPQEPRR